jgi:TRAP-type C4-dicarboxylate transport system permease small subunit
MTGRFYKASIWLGGLALLAAALIDTGAVLARNLATSLHGSIELIQVAILVAGALGLVIAVTSGTYARVHLLTDRLKGNAKAWMDRFAAAAVAIFFLCILAGSVWIAADLWAGHEHSEVMGVPWRWLRLFANLCLFAAILILLHHVWKPRK